MSEEFDKDEEFGGSGDDIVELDDDIDTEVDELDVESEFDDSDEEEDPDDLGIEEPEYE